MLHFGYMEMYIFDLFIDSSISVDTQQHNCVMGSQGKTEIGTTQTNPKMTVKGKEMANEALTSSAFPVAVGNLPTAQLNPFISYLRRASESCR